MSMKTIIGQIKELAVEYKKQGVDAVFVEPEIANFRMNLCKACPDLMEDGRCANCGCIMKVKTKLKIDPVESAIHLKPIRSTCPKKLW